MRARPTHHLKRYAVDEEGPIRLDQSVAWFWTTNKLVDHILKVETEAGILIKEKNSRAAKGRATPKPPAKQERETTTMAEGKRVRVTRGGSGKPASAPKTSAGPRRASPKKAEESKASAATVGRVARPPRGTSAPPPSTEAEAAPVADMEGVVSAIEASVSKVVSAEVGELKAELKELKAQISEARNAVIDALTIFHDIMAQTGGTLQYPAEDGEGNDVLDEGGNVVMEMGPELYPKESKIFAYLDGSAFEPNEVEGEE